ncbi:hypothetical protein [Chitinophaga sancti]|uniref:Uncharacterized protein n=1 Tax=Chitinophaga sancti TaxID=1004 RepID=A0A1K1LXP6_9BACT|nr:hypothetical protein [Chitinophaga sancti]WQD64762.1 hypothetical protein U0033_10175 [Chitinophaga sancti]WQG89616.1 hypothetical protein SR876_32300 [Chitinophaga sancti]SFW15697.1 hypothetical protein SAMN05661012_00308 [Chitinophaga sancti]
MEKKKYRFRKMYFICDNNQVIAANIAMTCAYQFKDDAVQIAKQRTGHFIWENQSEPVPLRKVEGFFLVHETLFDEILKQFTRE